MPDLVLNATTTIPASDLQVSYARSSGPGGQNVNKVETKVELRLHLEQTRLLSEARKQRLRETFPSHVTAGGDFVVTSDRFRSQGRNQDDAFERLRQMLLSIWQPPRPRIKTKPSRTSRAKRIENKRQRGEVKRERRWQNSD